MPRITATAVLGALAAGPVRILASQLIGPAATQQHTITWATVPSASVISATADEVVVLLFIDQHTAGLAAS